MVPSTLRVVTSTLVLGQIGEQHANFKTASKCSFLDLELIEHHDKYLVDETVTCSNLQKR